LNHCIYVADHSTGNANVHAEAAVVCHAEMVHVVPVLDKPAVGNCSPLGMRPVERGRIDSLACVSQVMIDLPLKPWQLHVPANKAAVPLLGAIVLGQME